MWDHLTSAEIEQAKTELQQRRAAVLARHAEDLKRLDADATEIEVLDRLAAGFLQKFKPAPNAEPACADVADPAPSEPVVENAAPAEPKAATSAGKAGGKSSTAEIIPTAPHKTPQPDTRRHFERRHASERRDLTGTNFDMFSRAVSKAL